MKYYLAGGAIRDLLLGKKPSDYDFVFSDSEQVFINLNPSTCKMGKSPCYNLNGYEFSKLINNNVIDDLNSRDFTINSMLLEENGIIHMHERAVSDLKDKIIHPCSPSSFIIDPLRVFRAARFCAEMPEFRLSRECLELMEKVSASSEFCKIPAERVWGECFKALKGKKPGNFLRVLHKAKALNYWFQELSGASIIPAGPPAFHSTDVLEHIAATMDKSTYEVNIFKELCAKSRETTNKNIQPLTAWMSLCHDLGKTVTPEEIWPHHYKHEMRGVKLASKLASRLRAPSLYCASGMLCAKLHMKAGYYAMLRPATRVDLLTFVHAKNLTEPLFLQAQADSGQVNLLQMAKNELKTILNVSLPTNWQDKGKASGEHLRQLRCAALPKRPKNNHT